MDRRICIVSNNAGSPAILTLRASVLSPWVAFIANAGASAEALQKLAGIHPELLQQPTAVVPFKRALRWIELAGVPLGTAQLGVHVGSATPIEALGSYGRVLASALTLHQYVQQGISLYRTLAQGQTIWLSAHDNRARVNLGTTWKLSPGDRQARMNFLAVTIANIRRFAGPQWSPTELSFGFERGYADASNFTRAFRQLTGVTPSAFRQTAGLG